MTPNPVSDNIYPLKIDTTIRIAFLYFIVYYNITCLKNIRWDINNDVDV